jgi:hypothetical protein
VERLIKNNHQQETTQQDDEDAFGNNAFQNVELVSESASGQDEEIRQ